MEVKACFDDGCSCIFISCCKFFPDRPTTVSYILWWVGMSVLKFNRLYWVLEETLLAKYFISLNFCFFISKVFFWFEENEAMQWLFLFFYAQTDGLSVENKYINLIFPCKTSSVRREMEVAKQCLAYNFQLKKKKCFIYPCAKHLVSKEDFHMHALIECERTSEKSVWRGAEEWHCSFLFLYPQNLVAMTNGNSKQFSKGFLRQAKQFLCDLAVYCHSYMKRKTCLARTGFSMLPKGASKGQCVTGQSFNPPGRRLNWACIVPFLCKLHHWTAAV